MLSGGVMDILKNQLIEEKNKILKELENQKIESLDVTGDLVDVNNSLRNLKEQEIRVTRLNNTLKKIEIALSKIMEECYGICEECDEAIPVKRLEANPHSIYCVGCQEIIEKRRKNGIY